MKTITAILSLLTLLTGCGEAPVNNQTINSSTPNSSTNSAAPVYILPPPLAAAQFPADIDPISLARLPEVQRTELDAPGQDAFDTYVSPGTGYETGLRGPIGMWMHSPALAKAIFPLREHVRFGTAKDQRLTELTIISTAREINNQYEHTAHEGPARDAGLEEEIIEFVKYRRPFSEAPDIVGFGAAERTIIQFVREVVSEEKVSSDTFARAIELFGRDGVTDLVGLIGYYNLVAVTLKAFDVHHPPGRELLLPVAAEN